MKHPHAGEAFFDPDTAAFLLEEFSKIERPTPASTQSTSSPDPSLASSSEACLGEALGPNWIDRISLQSTRAAGPSTVITESECLVQSIKELPDAAMPIRVELTNGCQYDVDVVIAALGVDPYLSWVPPDIERGKDGGLRIDRKMQTSDACVYAAGDCCTVDWGNHQSPHWFQMRLWSQV